MRLDKLTTALQQALGDAQSLALANDHAYIEPVHVLLALLRQTDGAAPLLQRAGVNVKGLSTAAEAAMKKLPQVQGQDVTVGQDLARLLQASSHCGLGHTACNPLVDTLKRFRPAYERRLQSTEFEPAFDLDGPLARARAMTGRDDAGAHIGAVD